MSRFYFWQRWLFVLSVVIILFGMAMALLNSTILFDIFNNQIDPVFWADQPLPAQALAFRGWAYGLIGATMAGWGVFIAFVVHFPFARRESWAWMCVALGILLWYITDTAITLSFGVRFNAIFNTVLLALVALPLLMTRKDFSGNDQKPV